jgi:hypothetical protein
MPIVLWANFRYWLDHIKTHLIMDCFFRYDFRLWIFNKWLEQPWLRDYPFIRMSIVIGA